MSCEDNLGFGDASGHRRKITEFVLNADWQLCKESGLQRRSPLGDLCVAPVCSPEYIASIVINTKAITPPGIVLNCATPAVIAANLRCAA